jgi:cyclopropane fatty-acyl-phospholipid synthase-like methyltransferase
MARPYSALERLFFGGTFQAIRISLLPALEGASHVLVLGEGDGRFVSKLLAQNPNARAVVVDGSIEMLHRAKARCSANADRVEFVCANALDWLAAQAPRPQSGATPFDAVVTTFFLDCLTEAELSRLVTSVHLHLAPDARWLWADLIIPARGWQRYFAQVLVGWLYAVFALTTNISARRLVDPQPHFAALGWVATHSTRALAGVLESRVLVRS